MKGARRDKRKGEGKSHDLKKKKNCDRMNLLTSSSKFVLSRSSVVICIRLRTASSTSQLLWSKRIPAMTRWNYIHSPCPHNANTQATATDRHTYIHRQERWDKLSNSGTCVMLTFEIESIYWCVQIVKTLKYNIATCMKPGSHVTGHVTYLQLL